MLLRLGMCNACGFQEVLSVNFFFLRGFDKYSQAFDLFTFFSIADRGTEHVIQKSMFTKKTWMADSSLIHKGSKAICNILA